MARGGKRAGAGRPRKQAETLEVPDKNFATRVLERIGMDGWMKITRDSAKNAEEYALALLTCGDRRIESENFNKLLDRRYGKPAQPVKHSGPNDDEPMRMIIEDIGSS